MTRATLPGGKDIGVDFDVRRLWSAAVASAVVVGLPFSTTAALSAKFATAFVNLVIGIMAGSLVGGAATRSIAGRQRPPGDT
jgi:hypothetical protein